jgi:hypothetical protein
VQCFSGAVSSPLDQQTGSASSSTGLTSFQPGSVTPSANNELVVSLITAHITTLTSEVSISGGYTITDGIDGNGSHIGGAMAYYKQSTAGAVNPTWSWTTGMAYGTAASQATFKSS